MKKHTDLIIDSICCLILIALLFVPVLGQHASDMHAKANGAPHRVSVSTYHKGASLARP